MAKSARQKPPAFMHPLIFVGASVLLGILFASQEWASFRQMGYRVKADIVFETWVFHFFIWGIICWLLWRFLEDQIKNAGVAVLITKFLPLSIAVSIIEEMVSVLLFPSLPLGLPHMSYWRRVSLYVDAEIIDNMVIFWCAFALFRGIGYYQRLRENERTATQLEVALASAKMSALRSQLNPHFLFNTMNGISSLMRIDVDAADTMLEQLSSLLRITMERGDVQLITLREEMEFIETYLAMQAQRYAGRVRQVVSIDPSLYDALVPVMILQPIVENAYVHGLSRLDVNGELVIEACRANDHLTIRVINSGLELRGDSTRPAEGHGMGLTNIKSRLQLHYGKDSDLSLSQIDTKHVQVTVTLPLTFSVRQEQQLTRFGA
jgi:two-component system LytT family sensor kinase